MTEQPTAIPMVAFCSMPGKSLLPGLEVGAALGAAVVSAPLSVAAMGENVERDDVLEAGVVSLPLIEEGASRMLAIRTP